MSHKAARSSAIRMPSRVPWLVDAADRYGPLPIVYPPDAIGPEMFYEEVRHIVFHPWHLPDGTRPRITWNRHVGSSSNVLFADGHVATVQSPGLSIGDFDDGVRGR